MSLSNLDYLLLFLGALTVSGIFTPVIRKFAIRLGVVDSPNQAHKTHEAPVPYLGGLVIIASTVSITLGAALISNFTQKTFQLASTILVPALLMAVIGLIDDLRQLRPGPRFVAQNIVATVSAFILVRSDTLGTPTGLDFLDLLITVFWLVGLTNSINFFDNIDGGASGTVAISSLALSLLAYNGNQILIAAMSIVLAGSTLGFLIWNKPPARIYMGDAGALFLGILIASLSIRLDTTTNLSTVGLVIPTFLLAIPILDTSVAVIKRLRRRVSPFQGGKDHLSHRLIRMGLTKKSAVLTLYAMSAIFSILAIGIETLNTSFEIFLVALGILIWIISLFLFLNTSDS